MSIRKHAITEIWQKAASQGRIYDAKQWEHCSQLQPLCCHAVIEDWMILSALQSQCSSMGQATPIIAPSCGGSWRPSNTWFLEHTSQPHKNTIVFAQLTRVPNTQTTLCVTSVAKATEIWAWSVTDDAWWPALASYSSASAVQACSDSPSLSSAPSFKVPRRLLCASLQSFWSPTSAICQMSSTVSTTCSLYHPWDQCIFLLPDQHSGIHCLIIWGIQLSTPNNLGGTWRHTCLLDIRSVSALGVQ